MVCLLIILLPKYKTIPGALSDRDDIKEIACDSVNQLGSDTIRLTICLLLSITNITMLVMNNIAVL